jgi:hypothetical protein
MSSAVSLPMLCARCVTAIGRGGHMIQKARYHWPWAVGAGVVGRKPLVGWGEGRGLRKKGTGVAYFLCNRGIGCELVAPTSLC